MTQDAFFQQLKHPNPNLRERAMWEIVDSRDETTIPRLMGILGDEDVVYRRAAVKTLGAIGADVTPLVVESLLNSDNVTIRGSCAKALAQVAVYYREEPFPVEGLEGLKKSVNDPNPVVHIASVMALGEVGAPAFDILIEALNTTENVAIAVAIANALASIGDDRAKVALTQLINDESVDTYVRETATSALSRLELIMKNQPK